MIYHIYWGTSGNSGLYLDEIYQCLKDAGYAQKIFVNYYYPFDYGEKIFFRHSDIAHCKMKGFRRRLLQMYELLLDFAKILYTARRDKPEVVNYSLASGSYNFMVCFLKAIKRLSGCKLVVTCHDVCPFGSYGPKSREMTNRQRIFDVADYLLAHNDSSVKDLQKVFHIDTGKVVQHRFPVMDLKKLYQVKYEPKLCDFLFIGHFRAEKGVDLLIKAWELVSEGNKNATLWLCGRPQGQRFDINKLEKQNVTCKLEYVREDDYCRYIQSARYVVLPYMRGTNSGIVSTVLSLGANVITSDIPMFQDNPLVKEDRMFKSGDVNALAEILQRKYDIKEETNLASDLQKYRLQFKEELLQAYKTITYSTPDFSDNRIRV